MIKMGIYGLVRVLSLLPAPPSGWGVSLIALGIVSGVLGVAYAVGQHDLKRLLAYHSIENIGIIVLGLGLAMLGRSLGRDDLFVLGLAGALLHTWNHALFKSLLFLSAGSVIHAVHTREIDQLGGLLRPMPRTAACFLIGAVAICGLPPLNGFVSEFLIYLGLFRTLFGETLVWPGVVFGAPALALMGVLAAACFAKVFGAVFLGAARSEHARHAHESELPVIAPMMLLAACCVAIGVAPLLVAPVLQSGVAEWARAAPTTGNPLTELAPFGWISVMAGVLASLVAAAGTFYWIRLRASEVGSTVTWDCGYAAPTARMQYTSSSFAEMLVGLFGWALRPKTHIHRPEGLFPQAAEFESHVPDAVLDRAVLPLFRSTARLFARFRVLQGGSLQVYLLYIFVILVVLLLWSIA
jgi:hydrogenase-4 component B